MPRRAFTLLEVIIAMVILATFGVALLQVRLEGLRAGRLIAESSRVERALGDVLALAQREMLPPPRFERNDAGEIVRVIWEGAHLGFDYICVQEHADVPAPRLPGEAEAAATVRVRRLAATIAGETAEIILPPTERR